MPNQQPTPARHRTPPFSPKFTPTISREPAPPPDEKPAQSPPTPRRPEPAIPSTFEAMFGAPFTPPRTSIPEPEPPKPSSPSPLSVSGSVSAAFSTPSTPAPPPAAVQRKPINPFLANDPNQKARRLARALVSDMVAYHPTKREEGVQAGTLKQLFRDEIKKSYEEYVEQVGRDFAESTMHFQEALNDVLAGGRKIF
jgi:hypothetical protein